MFEMRIFPLLILICLGWVGAAEAAPIRSLALKGIYIDEESGHVSFANFVQDDQVLDVAFDASGNMYLAGYTKSNFSGTTNLGFADCYVAKYNSSGTLTWIKQLGTNLFDSCQAIVVADSGVIYVSGITQGAFAGETHQGNLDIFVLKLDSAGNLTWAAQHGTPGNDVANSMVVDSSNRPVVAGSTTGTFPGEASVGGQDALAFRLNPNNGNVAASVQYGTSSDDEILDVTIDNNNRWWIAGYTGGTFSGETSSGGLDAFLSRSSNAGAISWTRQVGSSADDYGNGAASRTNGLPTLVGTTEGTISGQSSAGGNDLFLVRYNNNGAQQMLVQIGTSGNDNAQGACTDSSTYIYAGGTTSGAVSGGGGNNGGTDAFVAKFDASGVYQWGRQFGSTVDDTTASSTCTTAGVFYLGGKTDGSIPGYSNAGGVDSFFARYSSTGTQELRRQFGGQ